jgi:hypothetical protein
LAAELDEFKRFKRILNPNKGFKSKLWFKISNQAKAQKSKQRLNPNKGFKRFKSILNQCLNFLINKNLNFGSRIQIKQF